jgi:hypothetical protein
MEIAVPLEYPFRGRWRVEMSPADRVPSHGTHLFATTYAIDFVAVDEAGRSGGFRVGSLLHPEPPRLFVGFGRTVLAPVAGTVVAAVDHEPDHAAHRGLASVSYALTQRRRLAEGWTSLAGNHVVIEAAAGRLVALCHLRQGTLDVAVGQAVAAGDLLAECGNSGNSTEPHVHLQAFDRIDVTHAVGLPISFPDGLPANGQIVEA